ncbi:MAG: DUF1572 family protein [Acidobacteria bacterium]|nr:DUF1572 family protein [Acidobacteriota bacterium]
MSTNAVADNFIAYAVKRLEQLQQTIASCLEKLTGEQLNHRGGDHENSIANLLLHLEGNLRQWILHGIDGQPDIRQRDAEFSLTLAVAPAEARARFNAAMEASASVIAALPPERLLLIIDPQPTGIARYPTILEAIFKVVGHVETHTGQIILFTKQMTGKDLDLSIPRKR